jgi:hypothetical protein
MKRKLSDKQNRVLWLVGSGIWLANAGLNGWLLITRWERLVDTGQVTMRVLMVLTSLACAVLYLVNWYRRKT